MKRPARSDITRTQFERIRELLLSAVNPPRRKRKYDLYDTFCAVLYIMDTGCPWKSIPPEYPDWHNVRHYYDIWKVPDETGAGVLEKALRQLAEEKRISRGDPETEWLDYTEIVTYLQKP
ncbi:MAG: transposase [Oscillospiraceae bacterium]|nr:transposase [Oscillospiraceae bacterium]